MKNLFKILCAAFLFVNPALAADAAKEPIKIGWIDTYTAVPDMMMRARHAAQMYVDDFNAKGGFHGAPIQLVFRDDKGTPASGVQAAQDLVDREKVTFLAGPSYGGISKAIYEWADHRRVPYFATFCSSDVCPKHEGAAYTFTFEERYDQTARVLAEKAASSPAKKWSIIRYSDAWDIETATAFQQALQKARPDVSIQTVIVPADASNMGPFVQALKKQGAEGIYVTLYGRGLVNYVRQARMRGLWDHINYLHPYLPPETISFLGKEVPVGWFVTGYPETNLGQPANTAFVKAFEGKYKTDPGLVGLLSYVTMKAALGALQKADSLAPDDIVKAAENLTVETPVGPMRLKASDHRADFTYWYGTIGLENGKPVLKDFVRGKDEVP